MTISDICTYIVTNSAITYYKTLLAIEFPQNSSIGILGRSMQRKVVCKGVWEMKDKTKKFILKLLFTKWNWTETKMKNLERTKVTTIIYAKERTKRTF